MKHGTLSVDMRLGTGPAFRVQLPLHECFLYIFCRLRVCDSYSGAYSAIKFIKYR